MAAACCFSLCLQLLCGLITNSICLVSRPVCQIWHNHPKRWRTIIPDMPPLSALLQCMCFNHQTNKAYKVVNVAIILHLPPPRPLKHEFCNDSPSCFEMTLFVAALHNTAHSQGIEIHDKLCFCEYELKSFQAKDALQLLMWSFVYHLSRMCPVCILGC